ncbi:MAG: MBL fold metallo-hydrolase, partial [Microcystaceae cyanobacterium]
PPTLKTLNPDCPVLGSPKAAQVVTSLGFSTVTAIVPGESFIVNEQDKIQAFAGSPIGPTTIENAYLLTDLVTGYRLYYEPHGFHSPDLKAIGTVDAVLTPVVGASLLHLIPVLQGQKTSVELCQWLKPQVIIPTSAAADIQYGGLIGKIFREEGTIAEFRQLLTQANLATEVLPAEPGQAFTLPC